MGKFRKNSSNKEIPKVSTASLPDIVMILLFFFMSVTSMKEITNIVHFTLPTATELQSLEKKSLVRYIYVGKPIPQYQATRGTETQIQLDDAFADVSEVETYITDRRSAMAEQDQGQMIVALKIDRETKMGIVTDIKQALRRAYALRISYTATHALNQRH